MDPGDFLLVRTDHFVSKLIRFGQRDYGPDAAQYNHVALYVGDGMIVEALTSGVCLSKVTKYTTDQVRHVSAKPVAPPWAAEAMRVNAAAFAKSCVGESYGWVTIAAIALKALTKGRLQIGVQGTSICSGLVARSLERLGYDFQPYDPAELTPAYLAKFAGD
jgi:cell wall-associated NlpC family hydrolase